MRQAKIAATALIALALQAGTAFATADGAQREPLQKVLKNWQVTCNNLNDCDVRSTDPGPHIVIERQAGPDGAAIIRFSQYEGDAPTGIWIDGKKWSNDIRFKKEPDDVISLASSSSLSRIQAFIRATRNASKIALSQGGDTTSLNGLNAALLLVDERQGRLNNQSALFKTGNLEPSAVLARVLPPALDFPVAAPVPLKDPQRLIEGALKANSALLHKEECEPDEDARSRSEALPLNDKQALVLINCGMGAYQSSSMLFISDREEPEKSESLTLTLPLSSEEGKPNKLTWFTEAEWDPKTATLSFSGRGRGIGDCGDSGSWKYDGKTFHLTHYNSQPTCDGGEPGDWPSVWQTSIDR